MNRNKRKVTTQNYLGAKLSLVVALFFFIALNVIYAENKSAFLTSDSSPFYPDLSLVLLCAGSILILYGALSFLQAQRRRPMSVDSNSRVRLEHKEDYLGCGFSTRADHCYFRNRLWNILCLCGRNLDLSTYS